MGNNPVKYVDPDGRSPLSWLIPNPNKISKEEARHWIEFNVCVNAFGYLVCQDMYSKAMSGNTEPYIRGKDSYIAIVMANDLGKDTYVNAIIPERLKQGITSGGTDEPGRTRWTKMDLKLSIGSCYFSWELMSYDKESKIATVSVHITDIFDFNEGEGNRSKDAEKLTALGRKAELAEYYVDVTYQIQFKVNMPEEAK